MINVAELFEIYVTKLLQHKFPLWRVDSPQIETYSNQFFARKIIPDIVMIKDDDVMVFDTKYKRMKFKDRYQGADVDRCDFFQINTYMSYYLNQNYNVKVGGLLYPIEEKFNEDICHSENWFGNNDTNFIVDGIDLSYVESNIEEKMTEKEKSKIRMTNILNAENNFIKRIKNITNQT